MAELNTYGDLKKVIKSIALKQKGEKIGQIALDTIIGFIPGAETARTTFDFIKAAISKPDTKKTNTWLDRLDVDDEMSRIVDDTVENSFMQTISKSIESEEDGKPLEKDFNMNAKMVDYLQKAHKGRTIVGIKESNNKKLAEDIAKKIKKEISVTGGEGYLGKTAFNPNKKAKGTAHNYLTDKMKWKENPSVPNRPSKMIDYKQLFEDDKEKEILNLQKIADDTSKMPKERDQAREKIISLKKELTNENYNRFRNETKTRSKPEQYHKAVLEVKKRTNELNKLLEYACRLKEEINEVDEIKSSRHTLNALDKVTETIKEVYIKAKKLK
jgi:hypothetical protein